jgi:hypothetical protein
MRRGSRDLVAFGADNGVAGIIGIRVVDWQRPFAATDGRRLGRGPAWRGRWNEPKMGRGILIVPRTERLEHAHAGMLPSCHGVPRRHTLREAPLPANACPESASAHGEAA